jgi:sugar lactone lactonase YvrE
MLRILFATCFLVFLAVPDVPAAPTIETVAGTGSPGDNGREGPADEINIDLPFGVEFGPDGALYICEVGQHRVRRLDLATKRLSTVAGSGRRGYRGDGGLGAEAELNEPYEVRFDRHGNMLFVEMRNCVVRRVDRETGRISTLAGTGQPGFSGDGGPAPKATLRDPHSIALDSEGNLYIADIGNHRIRRVDAKTGAIETVAGNGEKKLPDDGARAKGGPIHGPRALYVAGKQLWIALREGNSIWVMDLAGGTLRRVAGTGKKGYSGDGGQPLAATFNGPKGIALDAKEYKRIVIADTENQVIRTMDVERKVLTTVAGAGPQALGYGGDGGPATQAKLSRPHGICYGPDGAIYIGDTENHRVRRVRN